MLLATHLQISLLVASELVQIFLCQLEHVLVKL